MTIKKKQHNADRNDEGLPDPSINIFTLSFVLKTTKFTLEFVTLISCFYVIILLI